MVNRARVAIGASIVAAILAGVLIERRVALDARTRTVAPAARSAVQSVLRQQAWSRISGGDWEGELTRQFAAVANLAEADRVSFQEAILLNCQLDASRAELFIESVGVDALPLRNDLLVLKSSAQFETLTRSQRLAVDAWIAELGVVLEQGGVR